MWHIPAHRRGALAGASRNPLRSLVLVESYRPMLSGHLWTIAPYVARTVRPPAPPPARHFRMAVPDPIRGTVHVSGRFDDVPDAEELVVFLHGMGGHAAAPYMVQGAQEARAQGMASLRLNLRGADRLGEDYYHAGLTVDVATLFQQAELARFSRTYLVGFSLGGHVALAASAREELPSVSAVAAICAPIALEPAARALDEPVRKLYRRKLLSDLKLVYRDVANRHSVPIAVADAARIESIVDWDDAVVAPRFGYASARAYYQEASVAQHLQRIAVPTLALQATQDPMVLARTTQPLLRHAKAITTKWVKHGGHLAFPRTLDLGFEGGLGLNAQVLRWLRSQATHR